MGRGSGRRVRVSAIVRYVAPVVAALAVAGCNTVAQQSPVAAAPRGATVAFDSIDGPPRHLFDRLVSDLNNEAQRHRLAVMSRDEGNAAYRVHGYMIAENAATRSAISWVWDVYDRDHQRVLRLTGEDVIAGTHTDAWQAVDDASIARIAGDSMDQLAAFLTSPQAEPGAVPVQTSYSSDSPEAAGIFRIMQVDNSGPGTGAGMEPDSIPLPHARPRSAGAARLTVAAAQNIH
jgi:hypothetical protein